jgi:hypothetical protein
MAAPFERAEQLILAQRHETQNGVVHRQFAMAAQAGGDALAVVAEGLPQATCHRAQRSGSTERETAGHQVDADPGRRARRHAGGQADAHLAQSLGIEQVVIPTPVGERQFVGAGVVGAEAVEPEQGIDAGLLALAHRIAQARDGGGQRGVGGVADPVAARCQLEQQFGNQAPRRQTAFVGLVCAGVHQPLQRRAMAVHQRCQGLEQLALAFERRRHGVEADHRMQVQPRQRGAPVVHARVGRGHEVEHRQQRTRATRQQLEFIAVLGQHRVARIHHVQRRVAGEHLSQHLGLLLETPLRIGRGEEALDARRPVETLAGRHQGIDELEQRDRVFHARRVEQFDRRPAVGHQAQALDVARRACGVRHLAEGHVARQRAQQ